MQLCCLLLSLPSFMKLKINWDALGIGASLACAIHCALLPLFLSSLPLFGTNIINNTLELYEKYYKKNISINWVNNYLVTENLFQFTSFTNNNRSNNIPKSNSKNKYKFDINDIFKYNEHFSITILENLDNKFNSIYLLSKEYLDRNNSSSRLIVENQSLNHIDHTYLNVFISDFSNFLYLICDI